MGALCVVVGYPVRNDGSGVNWAGEHRFVQELVAHSAVEAFHEAILHWLAGRDVVPFDLMRSAPVEDRIRGQFCPIVTNDHPWLSAPFDQDGQFARHPTPGNQGVRYRGKTLAVTCPPVVPRS